MKSHELTPLGRASIYIKKIEYRIIVLLTFGMEGHPLVLTSSMTLWAQRRFTHFCNLLKFNFSIVNVKYIKL